MKNKNLFLITSLCGACLLTSACTTRPTPPHDNRPHHEQQHNKKHGGAIADFHKKHPGHNITKVKANMSTHSSNGGTTEMGSVWFTETPQGLKMTVDLVYLRPDKTYTAEIYQCGECANDTCCSMEAMTIELPQIKTTNDGKRLKQSYMVRGTTTDQLNNANIVLTRDGGYKAAWGKLKQK